MEQLPANFWSVSATEMLRNLETAKEGLTSAEARQRLARYGLESPGAKTAVGYGLKDLRNTGQL
jgi:hypothetical protein